MCITPIGLKNGSDTYCDHTQTKTKDFLLFEYNLLVGHLVQYIQNKNICKT